MKAHTLSSWESKTKGVNTVRLLIKKGREKKKRETAMGGSMHSPGVSMTQKKFYLAIAVSLTIV